MNKDRLLRKQHEGNGNPKPQIFNPCNLYMLIFLDYVSNHPEYKECGLTRNEICRYMPIGHKKRLDEITEYVAFLGQRGLIDIKLWPNNGYFYISITEKGKEYARKILYDEHTRDDVSIWGINLALLDDYKNSLSRRLSLGQVDVEQKDGNLLSELNYQIISHHA